VALDRILIANRGEIAIRIARTLSRLGKFSVGVCSEVDRDALHARRVDECHDIGPAPSTQSYLDQDKILDVAKRTRCDAIIPGYGFLSENAGFARRCAEAGLTFIGPSPEAIHSMGSKTGARALMEAAGVPVVPGRRAGDFEAAKQGAAELGYPVMIKASAGGGGKGMRLVAREEDLERALQRAASEAEKSFGDATVYLEKALVNPRHVEVQVLGDAHGHLVHLFNRDCSVQRRHQKIIEEAPCPGLDPAMQQEMFDAALRAARAVEYRSAGTIEFLVSGSEFYFLEMNTRLQVEHPVTEMITGVDLVEQMVRVAEGEPLPFTQDDLRVRGWAVECRLYAEDPSRGYLPSPGVIRKLRTSGGPGFREDAGVAEGSTVTPYYDPLLSKLCAWGASRTDALDEMSRVLSECVVSGIATNLDLCARVMADPAFRAGRYGTGLLDDMSPSDVAKDAPRLAALCALVAHARARVAPVSTESMTAWQRSRMR